MLSFRYSLIAALCIGLAVSSCQCQCGTPPAPVEEAPQTSGFDVPKPQVAESLRVTPAEKPEPEAEPEEVGEAPPLPDDFPKDIPVMEDAEVAQVQNLANDAHNVIFMTAKPVAEITSFYREKMENSGWKVTQDSVGGSHAFVGFKRGDMIANLQVAEDPRYPGKRLIAIMYEQEKPLPFDEF
jgi:hypothetical protein